LPPTVVDGTPVYVDGVFNVGEVEVWEGSTVSVPTTMSTPPAARSGDAVSDIGYTPPVARVVDDGLVFPLYGVGDVLLTSLWHGTPSTMNPENISDYNAQIDAAVSSGISSGAQTEASITGTGGAPSSSFTESGGVTNAASNAAALTAHVNASLYQGTYLWYELCLKNLNGGPYGDAYVIATTPLAIVKTIDLSAPSSM
jgi:hypothetical protein